MAIQQDGILLFSEDPKVIGELLTVGRELGEQAGMGVTVVASGEDAGERAEEARARGADGVLLVHAEAPVQNGVEVDAEVLREAIRTATPKVILLGATSVGLELAARVAQEIGVPCASECMSLRIDADGGLEVERRVYGGRFVVRQVISGTPKIATVQPKRFAMAEQINNDSSCDVTEITVKIGTPRVHLVSVSERARSQVDITKADVIIAAGRGIARGSVGNQGHHCCRFGLSELLPAEFWNRFLARAGTLFLWQLPMGVLCAYRLWSHLAGIGNAADKPAVPPAVSRVASDSGTDSRCQCPACGDSYWPVDGLLCLGRYDREHRVYDTGGLNGNVSRARLEIGNPTTICRSSTLDVAMFSVVMLGSCDQGDRWAGNGHGD